MGHAVPRIACGNVYVLFIRGIAPDVPETIDWFHDLTRPLEQDIARIRPAHSCPVLQTLEPLFEVLGLAGLVIFPADDQNLVIIAITLRHPHVVIGHHPQTGFHSGAFGGMETRLGGGPYRLEEHTS